MSCEHAVTEGMCRHQREKLMGIPQSGACYVCCPWMFPPIEKIEAANAALRARHALNLPVREFPEPRICTKEGCSGRHRAKGLCQHHYDQTRPGRNKKTPPVRVLMKALRNTAAEYGVPVATLARATTQEVERQARKVTA